MAGIVETDLAHDRDVIVRADSLGTAPFSATHANLADSSPQKRSAVLCKGESGGASTMESGIRTLSLSRSGFWEPS